MPDPTSSFRTLLAPLWQSLWLTLRLATITLLVLFFGLLLVVTLLQRHRN